MAKSIAITNWSAYRLAEKIIQLCVNIIFGSVYKMAEILWSSLASLLVITMVFVGYLIGKEVGTKNTWKHALHILQESRKIGRDTFQKTWKTD